jgi:hypothetical protein
MSMVDNREACENWECLVKDMTLPDFRKYSTIENLRWFVSNSAVGNNSHPNFEAAMKLAKQITRYGSFDDNE